MSCLPNCPPGCLEAALSSINPNPLISNSQEIPVSRTMFTAGITLIVWSCGMRGAALSDERDRSPQDQPAHPDDPVVRRTITAPVNVRRTVMVPVRTAVTRPVRVTEEREVADQIQMELLVVELRGNVQRALKEADFHESPGSHRYASAADHAWGGESKWLAKELETMKAYAEIEILSRPHIRAPLGQPAEVQVSCGTPQIAYLVRTGKKTFELREAAAQPALGLMIKLTAQVAAEDSGRIEISPLAISTTTFDGREPIPGIDLDVGKPILSTRKLETSITVTDAAETSGIVLPGPSGRQAILFLRVRRVTEEVRQIPTGRIVEENPVPVANPKPNP